MIGSALYVRHWEDAALDYLSRHLEVLDPSPPGCSTADPAARTPSTRRSRHRGRQAAGGPRQAAHPGDVRRPLDPERATGPLSRWVSAPGPLSGDFRDWHRIRGWAHSIAAEQDSATPGRATATLGGRRPRTAGGTGRKTGTRSRKQAGPRSGARAGPQRNRFGTTAGQTKGSADHGKRVHGHDEPSARRGRLGRRRVRPAEPGPVPRAVARPEHRPRGLAGRRRPAGPTGHLCVVRGEHRVPDLAVRGAVRTRPAHRRCGRDRRHRGRAPSRLERGRPGPSPGVAEPDEVVRMWTASGVVPWAPGIRNLFIQVIPRRISGRAVSARAG